MYKGKLENITNGIYRFLREYARVSQNNPFAGNGITIGWDQRYRRLLLTIKNKVPSENQVIKVFNDNDQFWDNLQIGDLVWYKGKIIVFDGVNDSPYVLPC